MKIYENRFVSFKNIFVEHFIKLNFLKFYFIKFYFINFIKFS